MLQLNDIRESRFFKEAEAIGEAKGKAELLKELVERLNTQGRSTGEIADTLGISEARVREILAFIL